MYVKDTESSIDRPEKELKGFVKVFLEPGESKTVSMQLNHRAFAYYNEDIKEWMVEKGEFKNNDWDFKRRYSFKPRKIFIDGGISMIRYSRMTALEWVVKDQNFDRAVSFLSKESIKKLQKIKEDEFTPILYMLPIYRLGSEKSLEGSLEYVSS